MEEGQGSATDILAFLEPASFPGGIQHPCFGPSHFPVSLSAQHRQNSLKLSQEAQMLSECPPTSQLHSGTITPS